MIKLLVLDLDGTLFNSKAELGDVNRRAVLAAQKEKGVRVALASGRSYHMLKELCEKLGLDQYDGFVIGNNGQDLYDYKTDTLSKGEKIPSEVCRIVLDIAKKENLETFAHNNGISMYYSPKQGAKLYPEKETRRYNENTGYFEDEGDLDKIGIFLAHERNDAVELAERIQNQINGRSKAMAVNSNCIELVPYGMDKVQGIDLICERYGLDREEVLVMGDGQNDLGMAKKYPFVAMANSLEEVKKAAVRITLSNDEDGVAAEIEKSILKHKLTD